MNFRRHKPKPRVEPLGQTRLFLQAFCVFVYQLVSDLETHVSTDEFNKFLHWLAVTCIPMNFMVITYSLILAIWGSVIQSVSDGFPTYSYMLKFYLFIDLGSHAYLWISLLYHSLIVGVSFISMNFIAISLIVVGITCIPMNSIAISPIHCWGLMNIYEFHWNLPLIHLLWVLFIPINFIDLVSHPYLQI